MPDLIDNTQLNRFERAEDGDVAFVNYQLKPGVVSLTHFETPVHARGKGLAGRLMEAVVANARARGLKIEPVCAYAVDWMAKHPDVAAEIEA
jgi:predicted GNAT family acetyltransferase